VVLTGPSGAGKTTLLSVLLGTRRPDEGAITISIERHGEKSTEPKDLTDPKDLNDLAVEQWREQLAWVDQSPYLFAGTIADNVRLSRPDADDREVRQALDAAGLTSMPADRRLQERGQGLSAGERRRLAMARALLRDAPVVLLDEPTAGLDAATESDVLVGIRSLAARAIVIMASHRPAAIAMADQVITIESSSSNALAST